MANIFKSIFGKEEIKSVPLIDPISEITREGISKAYIPKFLYKPPFGYPRFTDIPNIRRLAASPYVEMCISTIIDEICAVEWDIVAKDDLDPDNETTKKHIEEVKNFFLNPNTNKESLEEIRRKYLRDILEVDSGVINKLFNPKGEMVEIIAVDGATFTKNPDEHGMMTDREDLILEDNIAITPKERAVAMGENGWITAEDVREKAAYFQYGWITGAKPTPFGKKELVWFEKNGRTDNVYGRSAVENLANTIQTLIYAIEYNLEYFSDNQIPRGIIGLENSNTDEMKAFKDQWRENQRVKDNAGNWRKRFHHIPVTNKTPIFTRLELTNSEMDILENQKWWAKLVWGCFGVTSTELGFTEDAKGMSNQIVQSNIFKKRTINPILRMEEYKYNREIISEFEFDDVEFKFLMFDVEDETKKAALYQLQLTAGWKSINEIRTEQGLEEVEWGEKQTMEEQLEMQSLFSGNGGEENEPMNKEKENLEKETDKEKDIKKKINEKAELKYKYIKRTGSPGKYIYWYKNPKTGKLERGAKPEKVSGGDCYEVSGKMLMNYYTKNTSDGWKLVHGTVVGQGKIEGVKYGHSWLEKGDLVFDYSNGRSVVIRKEEYYKLGQVTNTHKYTAEQMNKKLVETGNWGPWENEVVSDEELKIMQQESVERNQALIDLALSKISDEKKKIIADNYKQQKAGKDTEGLNSTNGVYTEEREQNVHKKIYQSYDKAIQKAKSSNPDVVFMAGIPGSGKTYSTKKIFEYSKDGKTAVSKENGRTYVIINTDDIKKDLPEYNGGDGASLVHEESSTLSKRVMRLAIKKNANVIFDGTLSNAKSSLSKVTYFEQAGYTTQAIYVDAPVEDAIFSAAKRYKDSGRYAHYHMIAEAEPSVRNTMNKLKENFNKVKTIKVPKRETNWNEI